MHEFTTEIYDTTDVERINKIIIPFQFVLIIIICIGYAVLGAIGGLIFTSLVISLDIFFCSKWVVERRMRSRKILIENGIYYLVKSPNKTEKHYFSEIAELWVVNGVIPGTNRVSSFKLKYPHSSLQQATIIGVKQPTSFQPFQESMSEDSMALCFSSKRYDCIFKAAYRGDLFEVILTEYTGKVFVAKGVYKRFKTEFDLIVGSRSCQLREFRYGKFEYYEIRKMIDTTDFKDVKKSDYSEM